MSIGMGVDVDTTLCLHPHGTSGSQAAGLMTSVPLSSLMSHLHTGCPQHVAGRAIKCPLSTLEPEYPGADLSLTSGYAHVDMQSSKQGAT